jgi:hypothetical protein
MTLPLHRCGWRRADLRPDYGKAKCWLVRAEFLDWTETIGLQDRLNARIAGWRRRAPLESHAQKAQHF